ncbi:hypothetical protein MXMO3_03436 (plasmid) [Maritalea myrionectae]|uniref:Cyclic nucleotide-binding domain-containing protein n=1 Tax=Maritalea myrionectae TaxID=454601 RepID=A0A2R4MJ09_9HYPH|nr:hypothetical protein MXMO3_03436 [Maritalea myrionectae]
MKNSPLVRKLSAFVSLSANELAVLEKFHDRRRTFVAGRELFHQGRSGEAAYVLAQGWAF